MDKNKVLYKIKEALLENDDELGQESIDEFAFHMTDWIMDFKNLSDLYTNPDRISNEEVYDILMKFLIHAPAHIVAAAEIFLNEEVKNIFKGDKNNKD